MRYVPTCGYISFGFEPVVAVPGVLVLRVDGHATRLYGPRPGAHDVPSDIKCLQVFVLQAAAMAQCDMASPVPPSSVSARHARSSEVEPESPQKTRRAHRRMWPTRVHYEPVGVESPTMTVPDLAGAIIYDCHPPLLPLSLRLKDIGLLPRARPVAR